MAASATILSRVTEALAVMILKSDRADPITLAVQAAPVGRRQLERDFASLWHQPCV